MFKTHFNAVTLALICASLLTVGAYAEDDLAFWETHPWAKFDPGSWKSVRVINESLDENGQVVSTSITDTRTTLTEISKTGYTLRVEATVDVAGKRFPAEPRIVRQGYYGEGAGQVVNVEAVGPGEVLIDGRKYPVEVRRVTINGDELKRVSLLHYSQQTFPHVLKRETTATTVNGVKPNYDSLVEVIAVEMPYRVLTETKLVSQVKTTHKQANGATTITLEVHSADVPGGVVAHSAKELNPEGRVIARSTLELIEFDSTPAHQQADESDSDKSTGRRRVFRSRSRQQ